MTNENNINLQGIAESLTEFGFARLGAGADREEVRLWGQINMYLAALGGAIVHEQWSLVADLTSGDISSDDVAEALGWL